MAEYPGVRLGQRGGLYDLYQYYLGGGDQVTDAPVSTVNTTQFIRPSGGQGAPAVRCPPAHAGPRGCECRRACDHCDPWRAGCGAADRTRQPCHPSPGAGGHGAPGRAESPWW